MTQEKVTVQLLEQLSVYCDEFLIHAVDVEGKNRGIEESLVWMLSEYRGIPVTYAGGVHSMEDIEKLRNWGEDRIDVTVGSALDLFGGPLPFETLCKMLSLPVDRKFD